MQNTRSGFQLPPSGWTVGDQMSLLAKNACLAAGSMCSGILGTKWRGFIRQLGNLGRIVLQGRLDGFLPYGRKPRGSYPCYL